jgi:small nuclear ribonucleoprotein (snRNP)-like protein
MRETLRELIGREIVVDTRSHWMYIGRLEAVRGDSLQLADADVHDGSEGSLPKERYILSSCETGIKANRRLVYVNLEHVVSVSPLAEVIRY